MPLLQCSTASGSKTLREHKLMLFQDPQVAQRLPGEAHPAVELRSLEVPHSLGESGDLIQENARRGV